MPRTTSTIDIYALSDEELLALLRDQQSSLYSRFHDLVNFVAGQWPGATSVQTSTLRYNPFTSDMELVRSRSRHLPIDDVVLLLDQEKLGVAFKLNGFDLPGYLALEPREFLGFIAQDGTMSGLERLRHVIMALEKLKRELQL